jgi:hypothetical protein
MIDNVNPNSQFHPYQPMNDTPASERRTKSSLDKVRDYTRVKPGIILGGLAALAIGAGLLRKRL